MSEKVNGSHPCRTLDDVWPLAEQHLRPALAFGRDLHRLEDVREAIDAGEAQLWPIGSEGTIVTEIREFPSGVRVVNFWAAGGSLGALVAAEPLIADWARQRGCHAAQILGRKGWIRALPHYEHTASVLWRTLKEHG